MTKPTQLELLREIARVRKPWSLAVSPGGPRDSVGKRLVDLGLAECTRLSSFVGYRLTDRGRKKLFKK